MTVGNLNGQCGIQVLSGLGGYTMDSLLVQCARVCLENKGDLCDCECAGCEDHEDDTKVYSHILWTDIVGTKSNPSPGEKLAAHIKQKKFGTVQITRPVENPNTKNDIRVYLWTPNKKFAKAYSRHYT